MGSVYVILSLIIYLMGCVDVNVYFLLLGNVVFYIL